MVVAIDVFSRFAIAKPVSDLTSGTIADFMLWNIIGPFGKPEQFITDGGPEFKDAEA